jgi:DNA-binding LacI/PurR family transcriptional regulator
MAALGRRAAEILLQAIAGRPPDATRLVLPTQLVVRDSTAPPPGHDNDEAK